MILLTSTSDLVQVITGGTQAIKVHASYVDYNGSAVTPNRQNTPISTATTTTIVPSPGSGVSRNVKFLSFYNSDSSNPDSITVQHTDGINVITLYEVSLAAGQLLIYADDVGWQLAPSTHGTFIRTQVITSGTTSVTVSASTNTIRARLLGSGGAGGGNAATADTAGSGGSSGGYAEWTVSVTPGSTYTCSVGAAVTGTSASAGGNGNATTLTVGSTTCTANGGTGGLEGTAAGVTLGPAGPSVSTNGTLNCSGEPGGDGLGSSTTTLCYSGTGGSSSFGAGGISIKATGNGSSAIGYGGGGGGSLCTTATAGTGGTSGAGLLLIDEYS